MGYVKVVKNKSFYKRYQVQYRRRRQNKTNYRRRRGLVKQDKRKFNAPKWRFIVRISNRDIICQVACARQTGDQVLCAAYSHELPRYGLKVGLTNYSACYCTGLLLARRLLQKLKLDKIYKGKKELDGNMFNSRESNVHWSGQKIYRPFKCILDVGIARTTLGARIFGALKGAVDGGLYIPHSNKRFPGFKKKDESMEKDEYNAGEHAQKIFGQHTAEYMRKLQENDPEKYNKHFSRYIEAGLNADNIEELYEKVHSAIRKDPRAPPKKQRDYKKMQLRPALPKKLNPEERRLRRVARIEQLRAQANAVRTQQNESDDEDDDDEDTNVE